MPAHKSYGGGPRTAVALLVLLSSLLAVVPTRAQTPPAPPPAAVADARSADVVPGDLSPESADALKALVQALRDPATRETLVAQMEKLVADAEQPQAAGDEPSGVGAAIIAALASFKDRVAAFVAELAAVAAEAPDWIDDTAEQLSDPAAALPPWAELATEAAVVLLAGLAAQILVRLMCVRPRRRLEQRKRSAWSSRLAALLGRTILDLLPIVAFAAVAYGMLTYTRPSASVSTAVLAFINAFVLFRVIIAGFRALTSPAAPALRLLPLSDEASQHVFIWARRFAAILVFGYFAIEAGSLWGLGDDAVATLHIGLGVALLITSIVFTTASRRPVSGWIRAHGFGEGRHRGSGAHLVRQVAAIWHLIAILYLVVVFVVWLSDPDTAFVFIGRATALSAAILCGMYGLLQATDPRHLRRLAPTPDPGVDAVSARRRIARWLPAVSWTLRGGVIALGVVLLLAVWSSDASAWLFGSLGVAVIGALLNIVITVIAAVAVWELAMFAIDRYLGPRGDDGRAAERSARARTLVPLLQNTIMIGLTFVAGLMVLAELGVSIAPLLASAGVAGLAIGFGAQKLVQDVITGAFILFEDAIAVGDVINVSGTGGAVEGITIRTIKLRDLSGNLHIIPFSAVDTITNMTKDYSYYVLDIGVAYREDTDQVTEVIKAVLEEMREDPAFGPKILEPLDVLGVDKLADSAVIIKARIKTLPIQQWTVGREFNRRMKRRFDALGIEIPYPHHTVYFGVDKDGHAPPARIEPVGFDGSVARRAGGAGCGEEA